jgi:hypothetical protein
MGHTVEIRAVLPAMGGQMASVYAATDVLLLIQVFTVVNFSC